MPYDDGCRCGFPVFGMNAERAARRCDLRIEEGDGICCNDWAPSRLLECWSDVQRGGAAAVYLLTPLLRDGHDERELGRCKLCGFPNAANCSPHPGKLQHLTLPVSPR